MKREKKVLALVLIAILLAAMMAACGGSGSSSAAPASTPAEDAVSEPADDATDDAAASGEADAADTGAKPLDGVHFVIAVNAENAPMESVNPDGEYVGYTIDLADALAEKLGFTMEWQDMEFFGLIGSIQEGKADMILSSISATEERKEMVDFTDGYYRPVVCIISGADGELTTVEDLDGKKVGAATGTAFERFANLIPGAEVVSFDSTVPAIAIIGTPELDAIIESSTYGLEHGTPRGLTTTPITYARMLELDFEVPPYAIALPKGSPYVEDFNKALAELKDEGFIEQLNLEYLGEDYVQKSKIANGEA